MQFSKLFYKKNMFYGMFLIFIKGKWAYFSRKSISLRDFIAIS